MANLLGILGGMGPLASAELVHTLYRLNLDGPEQGAPRCVLLSDPSFPDRTEAILRGETRELTALLTAALEKLAGMGADRIVIACVTIHHLLPEVPEPLRRRVISLLDLVVEEVVAAARPTLLLATVGTRRARIFERHPRFAEIEPWLRFLDEVDQEHLHAWIYRMKQYEPVEGGLDWLDDLPRKYGVERLIFGCTELHLLERPLWARSGSHDPRVIDPLLIVARDFARLMAG